MPMLHAAKVACADKILALPCVGVLWVADGLGYSLLLLAMTVCGGMFLGQRLHLT